MGDELWAAVYEALRAHNRGGLDPTPLHSLNRIFHKYVARDSLDEIPWLSPDNCKITSSVCALDQLHSLDRFHDRATPARDGGPIVTVEHNGIRYVVDGNNRLNLWLKEMAPKRVQLIVVTPPDS